MLTTTSPSARPARAAVEPSCTVTTTTPCTGAEDFRLSDSTGATAIPKTRRATATGASATGARTGAATGTALDGGKSITAPPVGSSAIATVALYFLSAPEAASTAKPTPSVMTLLSVASAKSALSV